MPAIASLNDGAWHYLLSSARQVVAAHSYTRNSLGNLALVALCADPNQPAPRPVQPLLPGPQLSA